MKTSCAMAVSVLGRWDFVMLLEVEEAVSSLEDKLLIFHCLVNYR